MRTIAFMLFVPLFTLGFAQAQVINNAVPDPTTVFEIDGDVSFEEVGTGGPGSTWDFSDLGGEYGTTFISFQPASEGAGFEHFPSATHVEIHDAGIGGNWKYFDFSGGTWRILGNYANFGSTESIVQYGDPHEYFTVPLTPGASGTDSYSNHTVFITLDWTKEADCGWEVDGSGTLILPGGTHTDVLRVKMECEEMEFMGASNTHIRTNNITHHLWVKEDIGHPLLMHTHTYSVNHENGDVDETYTATLLVSVEFNVPAGKNAPPEFGLHPNPATDFIHLKNEGTGTFANLRITDLRGRTVRSFGLDKQLYVGDLAPGMYFVVGMGSRGTAQAKFIKR